MLNLTFFLRIRRISGKYLISGYYPAFFIQSDSRISLVSGNVYLAKILY